MDAVFCNKREMAAKLGLSPNTLKEYRKKYWLEGIHYVKPNEKTVLYCIEACLHWIATRSCPEVHERWIRNRLKDLDE